MVSLNSASQLQRFLAFFHKQIADRFFEEGLPRRPADFFFSNQQMPLPRHFRREMPPDQMSIAPTFPCLPFVPGRGRRRFAAGHAPLDGLLFFQPPPTFAQRFL